MDPWSVRQGDVTVSEAPTTLNFEDNFTVYSNKLPDSEEYLAVLESKLRRIKNDPDILKQLAAKREACMQQLLMNNTIYEDEPQDLPLNSSEIIRAILPQQAVSRGEIVELVKHDHLSNDDNLELNRDSDENRSP